MRKLGPGLAVVALTFVVGLPLAAAAAAPRPGLGAVYRIDPRRNLVAGVTSVDGEAFGV